ncbi:hypothetical protein AOQ84DRAFT_426459 [Glonium stellatum]|uniref:Uncharacterized protein n=1 Tax=Glonium stellatum TaxID=574774 RepID=A0A8E2JVE3_9PEZI|nr:hypothetical protein AOQ84DRAFT_426459 [Glonium stellatum]
MSSENEPFSYQRHSRLSILSSWRMSLFSALERPVPDLAVEIGASRSSSPKETTFQAGQDGELSRQAIYRDLTARNINLAGLCLGWALSTVALATGIYMVATSNPPLPRWLVNRVMNMGMLDYPFPQLDLPLVYIQGHRACHLPQTLVVSISILLNIGLTAVLDSMNFIHSTTMRWALWREGRLWHNSNPRLFSCAKSSGSPYANRWFGNALAALSLALSYGATSLIASIIYVRGVSDGDIGVTSERVNGYRYGLDFNGWAVVGLGIGLFIQAAISTSCLFSSCTVETWSYNPITNAKACKLLEPPKPTSINASLDRPTLPKRSQPSVLTIIPSIRTFRLLLYLLTSLLLACTIITVVFAHQSGSLTQSYVISQTGRADFSTYVQSFGLIYAPYYLPSGDPYDARKDYFGLLIQLGAQGILTLCLHSAEVVVAAVRDEKVWRRASGRSGARFDGQDSCMHGLLVCWETWVLFVFKVLANCLFGLAVSCNLFVFVALLPLAALTLLVGILAGWVDALARWRPKGPQPATFGELRRLGSLLGSRGEEKKQEEVSGRLFWGDLGDLKCERDREGNLVRRVGTVGWNLEEVRMDKLYFELGYEADTCNGNNEE